MTDPRPPEVSDPESSRTLTDTPVVIMAMTGVRALAALWVVIYHLRDPISTLLPTARIFAPWTESGFLGVDVFFVLSGFIISHNYAERLGTLTRARYRAFIAARFARIYPIHLLALLLTACLVAYAAIHSSTLNAAYHYTARNFVGNLLMLQALPGIEPWNIPSWSVSCELAAYLAFPFFAARLVRISRASSWALIVTIMLCQIGLLFVLSTTPFYTYALYWVRIAGEFSVGCLAWTIWRRATGTHWRWDIAAVAAMGVAAAILSTGASGAYAAAFTAVPFLAFAVVVIPKTAGTVNRLLSSRLLQWGGRVSYSLYMVHTPVFVAMFMLHSPAWFAASTLPVRMGLVFAYFAVIIGAAAMSYYVVEEPARKFLKRRIARWPREDSGDTVHQSEVPSSTAVSTADGVRPG